MPGGRGCCHVYIIACVQGDVGRGRDVGVAVDHAFTSGQGDVHGVSVAANRAALPDPVVGDRDHVASGIGGAVQGQDATSSQFGISAIRIDVGKGDILVANHGDGASRSNCGRGDNVVTSESRVAAGCANRAVSGQGVLSTQKHGVGGQRTVGREVCASIDIEGRITFNGRATSLSDVHATVDGDVPNTIKISSDVNQGSGLNGLANVNAASGVDFAADGGSNCCIQFVVDAHRGASRGDGTGARLDVDVTACNQVAILREVVTSGKSNVCSRASLRSECQVSARVERDVAGRRVQSAVRVDVLPGGTGDGRTIYCDDGQVLASIEGRSGDCVNSSADVDVACIRGKADVLCIAVSAKLTRYGEQIASGQINVASCVDGVSEGRVVAGGDLYVACCGVEGGCDVRIAISTEGEVRASDGAIDVQQVARVEVHNVAAVDGASIGQQDVAACVGSHTSALDHGFK